MARTLDQIVCDTFGKQVLTIVQLVAENEALKDQIAALRQAQATPEKDT